MTTVIKQAVRKNRRPKIGELQGRAVVKIRSSGGCTVARAKRFGSATRGLLTQQETGALADCDMAAQNPPISRGALTTLLHFLFF